MYNKLHINTTIFGRVQGVGFRFNTKIQAQKYNLTGFVKNLENGNVYIEAEGKKHNIEKFIKWCEKGPKFSIVENIKIEKGKIKNFTNFEAIR